MSIYLNDFHVIRPNFETDQETLLEWISSAHSASRARINGWNEESQEFQDFKEEIREKLLKIGLGKGKIEKRGFHINDCNHTNWDEMGIYNIDESPEGALLDKRMSYFNEASYDLFQKIYPVGSKLPKHMMHVTCTGYVAPSPAQRLVSSREECSETIVTHSYHMGCYAAIPSIRIAMGHIHTHEEATDIVHTEFASIHMNPTKHSIDQLIVHSLFADGFIKYSVTDSKKENSLKILAVREEMISDSTTQMSWHCLSRGFEMTLAKEIPVLIRRNLEPYLNRLAKKAGMSLNDLLNSARFALHPGGTKIIEQIGEKLKLAPHQMEHSKAILRDFGNMSSATLPHVWDKMTRDKSVKSGEHIVSLAFGPGLSISGALFTKE